MAFGILFRRTSNSSPDPNLDLAKWKVGDIVCIYETSQCTEPPVAGSPHAILVVTGSITATRAREVLAREYRSQTGTFFGRSKWVFDPNQLPNAIRTALQTTGRAECTPNQFRQACFSRETGLDIGTSGELNG